MRKAQEKIKAGVARGRGADAKMRKLDKIDLKIIQILQKNARTPLKEIAVQS